MKKNILIFCVLITALILLACSKDEEENVVGPDEKINDVAGLVAAVCVRAATCPGISATQEEIDTYVSQIDSRFSESQIEEMGRFPTYTKSQQDCILECIGGLICDRFGNSISNMSDSDVIEPLRECENDCL